MNLEDEWASIQEDLSDGTVSNADAILEFFNVKLPNVLSSKVDSEIKIVEEAITSLSQGYAKEELAELAVDDGAYREVQENYSGIFETIGGKLIENAYQIAAAADEEGDLTLEDWKKTADFEAILNPLSSLNLSDYEELGEIWDNMGSFEPAELRKTLKSLGLDNGITDLILESYEESFNYSRELANKQIKNSHVAKDSRLLDLLTNEINTYQAPAELMDDINKTVQSANKLYEQGLTARADSLITVAEGFYQAATDLDISDYQEARSIIDDLDLTNIEDLTNAKVALEAINTDGQYDALLASINVAIANCSQNIDTLANKIVNETINVLEKIGDVINGFSTGFDAKGALDAYKKLEGYKGLLKDKNFDYFFEYDEALGKWVYTSQGMSEVLEAQAKQIEIDNAKIEELINNANDSVFELNTREYDQDKYVKTAKDYYNEEEGTYDEYWRNLDAEEQAYREWARATQEENGVDADVSKQAYIEHLQEQARRGDEAAKLMWDQMIYSLGDTLDFEKIVTGAMGENRDRERALDTIDQMIQTNGLSRFDSRGQLRAEEALKALEAGDFSNYERLTGDQLSPQEVADLVSKKAAALNDAVLKAVEAPGTIIDEATYNILAEAGLASHIKWDKQGFGIVTEAAADYVAMIEAIASQGGAILEEQNSTLASLYEKSFGADKAKTLSGLSSKSNLTFSDLADLATAQEKTLSSFFDKNTGEINLSGLTYNDFLGEFEVTDFDAYWTAVTGSLDRKTAEYLEAYSKWVNDQIDDSNKTAKEAQTQLDNLLDANIGDKVNVSYLETIAPNINDYLGTVVDGVATIADSSNLLGLLQYVTQLDAESNILENSVGELRDSIVELIEGWADAISSGLKGELDFTDAESLMTQFGLTDADFSETKNGLKLSKDAAYDLYKQLKQIAPIQAELVFDSIAESLAEAGSGYEDVASTMETIAKLNEKLANVPVDSSRREELERELEVAEEILRVRSQDPESFNFMDKDLPTSMQGPENYWNSVGEAYKVMNESAKSGYMEIQDYVNIINHMSQMVEAAGGEFQIANMNAAQLIEAGMSSLSNIDGEGVKVNLENLGIDILGGTEGMSMNFDSAIKEMARGQIEMLDAAIKMLETIVAMEELGNIDIDSDNQIELGEIFNLDENNKTIGFTEKYAESLVHVRNALVKAGIDLNQVTIGTHTLNDLLTTSYSEWETLGVTAKQQQQLINGLYQAVLSEDWDPNNISSIFSTWAQTIGESFAMHSEQVSIKVSDTGEIFAINWEDSNLEEKIKTAGFESKAQAQELVKKYINSASDETIEITSEDLYKIHILSGEITVTKNEDGETYRYNGQEYKDLNELKAILYAEEQTGHIGGQIIELPDGTIGVKQIIKVGNNEVTVVTSDGGTPEYTTDNGGKGATLEEAIADEYRKNGIRSYGTLIESQEDYEYRMGYKVKPVVTFPETFDTSDPTTRSSVTEFLSKGTAGIEQAIAEAQSNGDGTKTITVGDNLTFTVAEGATAAEIEAQIMQEMGIDQLQFESLTAAITTAITNAFSGEAGKSIGTAISTGLTTALGGENGELKIQPTSVSIDGGTLSSVTLADGTSIPEEGIPLTEKVKVTATADPLEITSVANPTLNLAEGTEINIPNLGAVKGDASQAEVTVLDDNFIPSAGQTIELTYTEGATGRLTGIVTVTNLGSYKDEDTSPEITGYTSANGTVETVTINGSSFKVTPVAGAPTNLDGELNPVESGFVKVEGNYYSVDLTSGIQLNPGMNLSGVTAGSAQVEATSYSVTFTNANGTTETVIVQGEAQLNAVLTGATQENGVWKIPNVTTEADVSISETSKSALETFFDTLVDKLKNIEIGYKEPTLSSPENPVSSAAGGYQIWSSNRNGQTYVADKKTYDSKELANTVANLMRKNGQTETEVVQVNAEGVRIDVPKVELPVEQKTETGTKQSYSKGETSRGQDTPVKNNNTEVPPLDVSPLIAAIEAIGTAASTAVEGLTTATNSLTSMDTSPIDTASSKMSTLAAKLRNIPSNGASKINAVATAIKNLKSKTITATVNVSVKVNKPTDATGSISLSNGSIGSRTSGSSLSMSTKLSEAKGNVALAKGNISGKALASGSRKTLMGELGPELVVSGGRYFIVGQNGAEFVNLANDAIVFNHLQTQRLLNNGRGGTGNPVTNERKATSLATGNVSGPAMASASEALAQLRQIRAMWQAMLDASAQDLGSKAGSGGGGNGGGGGSGEDIKAVTGELERWYNLLRQIDSLEQHITLEQAKRANMLSGYNHVDSLEKELEMLKEQQKAYKLLSDLQKDYYDRRREDLLSTDYSKIFTYTEHGLMQYVDGENRGLDILAKLNERDASGKLVNHAKNAKTQIAYLKSIGFDTSILKNNEDGTKAENEEGMMENFWAGVDGWMEELDGLYDSYHEAITNFEESTEKMNEILQEYIDNQLGVEQKLLQAIQDREQAEIDRIQDEKDALEEAAQSYIDGLNDALSKEQDMYSKNETNAETQKLQRQLAILQRSGGSTSEIKSLQDQIDSRLKDAYFQEQQDQIDAIQQASDNQLEKLQNQIDIMTESLEYQKEHGLLWNEVYEMMNQWTPEQMLQFIEEYTKSYQENSALQNEEDSKETLKELEIYTGKRDLDKREAGWAEYYANAKYDEELKKQHSEAAKKAYDEAFASGGASAGEAAANKVYDKALADKAAAEEEKKRKEEEATAKKEQEPIKVTQNGSLSGGQMNVRSSASAKSKSKGIVKSGKTFTAVGYKNGWLKVENAKSTNGTVSGYMKYTNYKQYYRGIDITKLPSYSKGGDIDFTGLAMVHGSKNSPENILSAEHTKLLRQGIFSNSNHSLAATVEAIQELARNMVSSVGANETGINIEQLSVNIQPGIISNDYDARRAGEMALEEMVKIARKTTNRVVSR